MNLGTAATHAATDFATPTTVSSAITALNLSTAATHAATDFDLAGSAANAITTAETFTTNAIIALNLGTAATHAATDFDSAGSAASAITTAETFTTNAIINLNAVVSFLTNPLLYNDFIGLTSSAQFAPFYYANFGTSPLLQAPSANIVAPNHPGVLQWRAGTSGTSGVRVGTDVHMLLIGGNEIYTSVVYFQSFTTEGYSIGFNDTINSGDSTNGVYIYMTSSGVFAGKTSQGSTRSTTSTNYTCSLSTWYRFVVLLASGASRATFYIYSDSGTLLWSDYLTTNLPTAAGQQTGAGNVAWSTRTDGSTGYFDTDMMLVNFGPIVR